MDCVFCDIIQGKASASVFYEDATVLGLMDIAPATAGHAMVIPRGHAASLADMDEETGRRLWTVTHRAAAAIRQSGIRCQGLNLWLADGEVAFQHIFHVHMHLVPRYPGDGFHLPDARPIAPRAELDYAASRIKAAYDRLWGGG